KEAQRQCELAPNDTQNISLKERRGSIEERQGTDDKGNSGTEESACCERKHTNEEASGGNLNDGDRPKTSMQAAEDHGQKVRIKDAAVVERVRREPRAASDFRGPAKVGSAIPNGEPKDGQSGELSQVEEAKNKGQSNDEGEPPRKPPLALGTRSRSD